MSDETVAITELLEIDPERVDAVGSPANGTEWLILKSIDDSETVTDVEGVLAEIAKADDGDKRPDCTTCKGTGKIRAGHVKCPKCQGSGVQPQPGDTEKSLAELAAAKESGAAASGADVAVDGMCGHCKGSGQDATGTCDACGGTGKDAAAPAANQLNTVDADAGKITEGAGGRETVDKATVSTADQNDLPDSDFAYIEPGGKMDKSGKTTPRSLRHFPIMDAAHVRNALARAPQSPFGPKAMPAIKSAAKKFGIEVSDASKAAGDTFSAPNPALADAAAQVIDVDPDTTEPTAAPDAPGSPAWEAVDAQTATDAALALMTAVELMRTFAQRESTEVAMGEGNDVFDAYAASEAICAAQAALGVMAQLAFHEGLEAAKSLPDDESVEKAGRRLAGKTVAALAAARDKAKDLADHIGGVLGDDDPKKNASKSADDNSQKDILDMTEDDLQKLVATTVAQAVVAAKSAEDELDKEDAPVKDAKKSKKDKAPADDAVKAEGEDAEVEVELTPEDAEKAAAVEVELTPEQIEARDRAKEAKKAAKAAKREEKELATKIALTKSIEESLTKVVEQNEVLKSTVETLTNELEGVKKMAAPSNGIVRTAPVEAQNLAKARDETQLRIDALEREARETSDAAVRDGNREIIKELRASMATK